MSKKHDDDCVECEYTYGDFFDVAGSINGTNYNDSITGTNMNDVINGFAGVDILRGGKGDDMIHGGDENDTLYGHDGNDLLVGGNSGMTGYDYLSGGNGDDVIVGGAGEDHMRGGAGHDTYHFYEGDSAAGYKDIIKDFNTYEDMINICLYKEISFDDLTIKQIRAGKFNVSYGDFTLDVQTENNGTLTADNFSFGKQKSDTCESVYGESFVTGANFVEGTLNADSLTGNALDNTINGFAGNDLLRGRGGNDSIHGGQGEDTIYGDQGYDLLVGGCDSDYISGGQGDDVVVGGLGADSMRGGSGNDIFVLYDGDSTCCETDLIKDFNLGDDLVKIYSRDVLTFDDVEITQVRANKYDVCVGDFNILIQTELSAPLTASDFIFEQFVA